MTTVLRLDPAYPTLWRGPSSMQFGIEPVAVVENPTPWQQRLLTELDKGIPDTALLGLADAFGVPDDEVREFVVQIERVLLVRDAVGAEPMRVALRADRSVEREAREQGKDVADHCAHLVVHGTLHAAGLDHDTPADAEAMEAVERRVLKRFGIADPYG